MPQKEEAKKILWVDDEIEHLKSHILFLEKRGFDVTAVSSGFDAIEEVKKTPFDLIFLDEMMPGMDGLATMEEIKAINPNLPVVMVTKNEEEDLMVQAIGKQITDYLTKPVNPSQVLMVAKRVLESKKIQQNHFTRNYVEQSNKLRMKLYGPMEPEDWIDMHRKLSQWDVEMDRNPDVGFKESQADFRKECNIEFCKYFEKAYPAWLKSKNHPVLSPDVVGEYVLPHLRRKQKVYFIVIDCMRYDQWLTIEPIIADYFQVEKDYYFSILPTATPFARNAIFSGEYPDKVAEILPEMWKDAARTESSLNANEKELLERQLKQKVIDLKGELRYAKVLEQREAENLARRISTYQNVGLMAMVFNFLDLMIHGRSESEILLEIAPDESAFRSLMRSWFMHSSLFTILKYLSTVDCKVVITTDHGSILANKETTVKGRKEASTNLRYKYGDNLNCNPREVMLVKNPEDIRLPRFGVSTTYIFAKEDYYLVYPTQYHHYVSKYANTFQHGGISLEELILPVITLTPRA
ncbi:MAG TPA: response regulator [candidate division Zixibacteria bacterium]|nr:response regulator [candidate division Zixibacteria bacterium]